MIFDMGKNMAKFIRPTDELFQPRDAMRSELQKLRDEAESRCATALRSNDRDTADAWERIGLALDECQNKIKHDVRLIEQRTGLMAFQASF